MDMKVVEASSRAQDKADMVCRLEAVLEQVKNDEVQALCIATFEKLPGEEPSVEAVFVGQFFHLIATIAHAHHQVMKIGAE